VISSFVLLTITYGQTSGGVQRGVSTIFSPLQDAADRALKPARDLVDWFDKTFDARGENSRLKDELEQARTQAVAGKVALQENAQFRKEMNFERGAPLAEEGLHAVTARVTARNPNIWSSTISIDVGSGDGVHADDPVMAEGALAGRVSSVEGGSAQVKLITDSAASVTAKIVPQGVQGVTRPVIGDPDAMILDYISTTRPVHAGEDVVTSGWEANGYDSIYPPNLPVGEVTHASPTVQEASQQVRLRPFADLANLDTVRVLTGGERG
jgi:rod shape-determining protein MreC